MNQEYKSFEAFIHKAETRIEYWPSRDLASFLEYRNWRNFIKVINRAMQAYQVSGHRSGDYKQ